MQSPNSALDPSDCAEAFVTDREIREAVAHDQGLYDVACRADWLRVSEDFILREIRRGKLVARRYESDEGRILYRIDPDDWEAYLTLYWRKTGKTDALGAKRLTDALKTAFPAN